MRDFVNCFFETIYEIPTFSPKFRLTAVLFTCFSYYYSFPAGISSLSAG